MIAQLNISFSVVGVRTLTALLVVQFLEKD